MNLTTTLPTIALALATALAAQQPPQHTALRPAPIGVSTAHTVTYLTAPNVRVTTSAPRRGRARRWLTRLAVGAAAFGVTYGVRRANARPRPIIITVGETRLVWTACPDPSCGGYLP